MNQSPSSPSTLSAELYRDAEVWPCEREAIFKKTWQFLTHETALGERGAYVADELAGYPVFVVRDEEGQLKGFHNVCRHRASPLLRASSGQCEAYLTCPYHGWRYRLDGRLRSARDFGATSDFDPRDFSLFPIEVEVWRGLIFIAIEKPTYHLAELMAPIETRLRDRDGLQLEMVLQRSHSLKCNWKTYVENYLEGYHIPSIHPALDAEVISDQYQVLVEGLAALHEVPSKSPDAVYEGVWGWVWPNVAVNLYRRGLMIERMSPLGHEMTRLDYIYLMPLGEELPADTLALSDRVTEEDRLICEAVQINLNAGIYQSGRLSPRHEGAVAAFQSWVRRALDAAQT